MTDPATDLRPITNGTVFNAGSTLPRNPTTTNVQLSDSDGGTAYIRWRPDLILNITKKVEANKQHTARYCDLREDISMEKRYFTSARDSLS
jgi:hypothetical protein